MSISTRSIFEAVERLSRADLTLEEIDLCVKRYTDAEVAGVIHSLLVHPNLVTSMYLTDNRLTDETGVKLARYVAVSSTIQTLSLSNNQIGEATYLALGVALCVNTSLRFLDLCEPLTSTIDDKSCIDAAFVEAMRVNPNRPTGSVWYLYSWRNEFQRLKRKAEKLGHPTMQTLLAMQAITN